MTLVYRRRPRAKSKKANIEKQKRSDLLFHDPIFMHHMLACLSRCLELSLPKGAAKLNADIDSEVKERIVDMEMWLNKLNGEREGRQK